MITKHEFLYDNKILIITEFQSDYKINHSYDEEKNAIYCSPHNCNMGRYVDEQTYMWVDGSTGTWMDI